jgi:hypothetical protein
MTFGLSAKLIFNRVSEVERRGEERRGEVYSHITNVSHKFHNEYKKYFNCINSLA